MTVIKNFEMPTIDELTVLPSLEAAHFAASVLLQMLVELRGEGAWIEEVHENMRNSLDRGPPPKGWPGTIDQWRDAQLGALGAVFAHSHMVGNVKPQH